jgi:hypothetical protein
MHAVLTEVRPPADGEAVGVEAAAQPKAVRGQEPCEQQTAAAAQAPQYFEALNRVCNQIAQTLRARGLVACGRLHPAMLWPERWCRASAGAQAKSAAPRPAKPQRQPPESDACWTEAVELFDELRVPRTPSVPDYLPWPIATQVLRAWTNEAARRFFGSRQINGPTNPPQRTRSSGRGLTRLRGGAMNHRGAKPRATLVVDRRCLVTRCDPFIKWS